MLFPLQKYRPGVPQEDAAVVVRVPREWGSRWAAEITGMMWLRCILSKELAGEMMGS